MFIIYYFRGNIDPIREFITCLSRSNQILDSKSKIVVFPKLSG